MYVVLDIGLYAGFWTSMYVVLDVGLLCNGAARCVILYFFSVANFFHPFLAG